MNPLIDLYDMNRVRLSPGERKLSEKPGVLGEVEAFVASSSASSKIPVERIHVEKGSYELLPLSVKGKTTVRFVGEPPLVSVEPGAFGNAKMVFVGPGAVQVIFNSERKGARGRNRGPRGQMKIFIVQ